MQRRHFVSCEVEVRMCLIPDPIATKQLSGVTEAAPNPYQSPEKSDVALISYCNRRYRRGDYSDDDEEDDGRDRQSHWKRIKTRSDDHPRASTRELLRYNGGRDHHGIEADLGERRQSRSSSDSLNHRPGHRMIILKRSVHDKDAGLHRSSDGVHDSEGRGGSLKGWDAPIGRCRDGGTASKDIDPGASKRKYESPLSSSMSHSPRVMYGRSMVAREKHMARRLPLEKDTQGYEVRVTGREFNGEDETLFLEDSRQADDSCASLRERPRITLDLREALNRRSRVVADTMSRENRGCYGDQNGGRGSDARVRVAGVDLELSFGNGKGISPAPQGSVKVSSSGRCPPSGNDEGKDFAGLRIGVSATVVGTKGGGEDMDSERRQEKNRTRWAEKERDLEKENMPKTQTKPVTVVDYSHKFTVAKAPISAPSKPVELDPHRLCQRQKQIDYGKNTLGYERYTDTVPRYMRTKAHPRTPDIRQVCSKRSWDGQIRKWRRLLHEYDPPKGDDEEDPDQLYVPTRGEHDSIRGSTTDDSLMDTQSEFVEDADLKIYDGWTDDEC